jgi:hypothetical protein
MVNEYLQNKDVLIRNQLQETFLVSRTVFIERRQTPVPAPSQESTMDGTVAHGSLKAEFDAISERYAQFQKAKREAHEAERR